MPMRHFSGAVRELQSQRGLWADLETVLSDEHRHLPIAL